MKEDLREKSRRKWVSDTDDFASINAGTLLRIADATEKMSQRHTELIRDRDQYERWYRTEADNRKSVERQLAAAKGQITKLRKKLAAPAKGQP